ncbi:hypothetical protein [Micromonospora cathayae]|uniref:Uncharacterized protein n=1 Tax=Micromonospora cathayae TaxID=3028804 RepID=A0ABY7ZT88_9ACTN|nr:hypothetical protein [Micromonospora sp. HUAS 3]WDZ86115.1 hypothetical protein PVK37_06765 [Micromonospora sp. HUAS 3]
MASGFRTVRGPGSGRTARRLRSTSAPDRPGYGTDRLGLLRHLAARMVDAAGELPTTVDVVERFLTRARR